MISKRHIQLKTDQLNSIARHPDNFHHHPTYTYVGTQGSDQALRLLQKYQEEHQEPRRPWGMIFNTDPIDQPGQHWIALYAPEHSKTLIEIMDSFGSDVLRTTYTHHPILSKLLQRVNIVKMPRLQNSNTYVCGHYCLAYLFIRSKGRSFSRFVRPFSRSKTRANDNFVYQFVKKVMMRRKELKTTSTMTTACQGCECRCNYCSRSK